MSSLFWKKLTATSVVGLCFVGIVSTASGIQQPRDGQPQGRYPDGSTRPSGEFQKIDARIESLAREPSLRDATKIASEAAALIVPRLPTGITLQQGTARLVMSNVAAASTRARSDATKPLTVDELTKALGPEQVNAVMEAIKPGQLPALVEAINPQQGRAAGSQRQSAVPGKWFISFSASFQGVPLSKFSDVLAVVERDGQFRYLRMRGLPRTVDASRPTVSAQDAIAVSRRHAQTTINDQALQVSEPRLEVWVNPALEGRLSWTFTIGSDPRARVLRYWVAATGTAAILDFEDEVYHTHFGAVTGNGWEAAPSAGTTNLPLPDLRVNRSGVVGATSVVTKGEDARFGFPDGLGNALASATLAGPHSNIANMASGGSVMTRMKTGTPTDPIDLNFGASGDPELAQVTAFYWTNFAFNLVAGTLGPILPNLPTRVNIASSCNAYWNGSSINFFAAGGTCPNMAYSDVVLHEYGHGADHATGGILDGGYSEGFGDSLATLGTAQHCVGRDFFGLGSCLRPATTVVPWPSCFNPNGTSNNTCGVHQQGWIYSGFTWELSQRLKNTFAERGAFAIATDLILAAAAGNPNTIKDAVELSFIADDDDGDLSNGTPHFAELAAAADARQIPRPADPPGTRGVAYLWADIPSTPATFTPNPNFSHNPAGGPISVVKFLNLWIAVFNGFGTGPSQRGHVQVTPTDAGAICQVPAWAVVAGTGLVAIVICRDPVSGNALANKRFNLAAWL